MGVSKPLQDGEVTAAKLAAGAVTAAKLAAAAVTPEKLNGAQSGSAPVYGCRAWVNFNGVGTVAIRGSGNVTSITDNGTGSYTVNFATAMQDANYASVVHSQNGTYTAGVAAATGIVATHLNIYVRNSANAYADYDHVSVAVFR